VRVGEENGFNDLVNCVAEHLSGESVLVVEPSIALILRIRWVDCERVVSGSNRHFVDKVL
jgi:hypothetical protein